MFFYWRSKSDQLVPMVPPIADDQRGSRRPAPDGKSPRTNACACHGDPTREHKGGMETVVETGVPKPAWGVVVEILARNPAPTRSSDKPAGGRRKKVPQSRMTEVGVERTRTIQLPAPRVACGVMVSAQGEPMISGPVASESRLIPVPL